MAKPPLKWVGGKRRSLPQIVSNFPKAYSRYFEPFVGGGALFFALEPAPGKAFIGDANDRLVRTYIALKTNVEHVITRLKFMIEQHKAHGRAFYDEVRKFDIDREDDSTVAAWMLYLNRTCFNGVYRVNQSGVFNVPFGSYPNPNICDEPTLRAAAALLQGTDIRSGDFSWVEACAQAGDLVYFDPPYVPLSATSSFVAYTDDGFGMESQIRLRDLAVRLKAKGVHVLLSNSSAPAVRELYEGFDFIEIQALRAINCKGDGRSAVTEYLIK